MPEENENKEEQKQQGENKEEKKDEQTTPPASNPAPPPIPPKPFPEPKVLEAIVDPKQKAKEGPVAFSFTTPQAIQQKQAEPSKGDVANKEESEKKKPTLAELDAQIARDEKSGKVLEYSDYEDSATMFVDAWEAGLIMICRAISKDTSDSSYGFPAPTREKLIRHGIKVSRKRGWVVPIELLAGGTLVAATGTIIMKASDKRKEYLAKKKSENPENVELNKGGPNKGTEKRRGPGRPSK